MNPAGFHKEGVVQYLPFVTRLLHFMLISIADCGWNPASIKH